MDRLNWSLLAAMDTLALVFLGNRSGGITFFHLSMNLIGYSRKF